MYTDITTPARKESHHKLNRSSFSSKDQISDTFHRQKDAMRHLRPANSQISQKSVGVSSRNAAITVSRSIDSQGSQVGMAYKQINLYKVIEDGHRSDKSARRTRGFVKIKKQSDQASRPQGNLIVPSLHGITQTLNSIQTLQKDEGTSSPMTAVKGGVDSLTLKQRSGQDDEIDQSSATTSLEQLPKLQSMTVEHSPAVKKSIEMPTLDHRGPKFGNRVLKSTARDKDMESPNVMPINENSGHSHSVHNFENRKLSTNFAQIDIKRAKGNKVDDYHPYRGGNDMQRSSMISKKNMMSIINSHKKSQNKFQHQDTSFEHLGLSGRRHRQVQLAPSPQIRKAPIPQDFQTAAVRLSWKKQDGEKGGAQQEVIPIMLPKISMTALEKRRDTLRRVSEQHNMSGTDDDPSSIITDKDNSTIAATLQSIEMPSSIVNQPTRPTIEEPTGMRKSILNKLREASNDYEDSTIAIQDERGKSNVVESLSSSKFSAAINGDIVRDTRLFDDHVAEATPRLGESNKHDSLYRYSQRTFSEARRLVAEDPYSTLKKQRKIDEKNESSFNFIGGSMKKSRKGGSKLSSIHAATSMGFINMSTPLPADIELNTPGPFFGTGGHERSGDILRRSESLENIDLRKEAFEIDSRYQGKFEERFKYNGLRYKAGDGQQLEFISQESEKYDPKAAKVIGTSASKSALGLAHNMSRTSLKLKSSASPPASSTADRSGPLAQSVMVQSQPGQFIQVLESTNMASAISQSAATSFINAPAQPESSRVASSELADEVSMLQRGTSLVIDSKVAPEDHPLPLHAQKAMQAAVTESLINQGSQQWMLAHSNTQIGFSRKLQHANQVATGKVLMVPRSKPLQNKDYQKIYGELAQLGVKKPAHAHSVEPRDPATGGVLTSGHSLLERKTVAQVSAYKQIIAEKKAQSLKKLHSLRAGPEVHHQAYMKRVMAHNEDLQERFQTEFAKFLAPNALDSIQRKIERQDHKKELKSQREKAAAQRRQRLYKEAVWAERDPAECLLPEDKIQPSRIKPYSKEIAKTLIDAEDCPLTDADFNLDVFMVDYKKLSEQKAIDDKEKEKMINKRFSYIFEGIGCEKKKDGDEEAEEEEEPATDSSDCSDEKEQLSRRRRKIRQFVKDMPRVANIDFELKEHLLSCKKCALVHGKNIQKFAANLKKDPNWYKHIIAYKQKLKKEPVYPEELSTDAKSMAIAHPISQNEKAQMKLWAGMPTLKKAPFTKTFSMVQQRQLYKKFLDWQVLMWERVRKRAEENEIARRPEYIKLYEKAKGAYMDGLLLEFKLRAEDEQDCLESIWKSRKEVLELRKNMKYILDIDNIDNEDFIENLVLVRDQLERQEFYFDQVRDLLFIDADKDKSVFDRVQDGELKPKPNKRSSITGNVDFEGVAGTTAREDDDRFNQHKRQYVDEIVNRRQREVFLQKEAKQIFNPMNLEQTGNAQVEFAKACVPNLAVPVPSVMEPPELAADQHFVILNQSLTDGQVRSIADAFPALHPGHEVKQLYFADNQITGDSLGYLLKNLASEQRDSIKSIVLAGKNELTKSSAEALVDLYMSKTGVNSLQELKLINMHMRDYGLTNDIIQTIQRDTRLQSLSLARSNLEPRAVVMLAAIVRAAIPCLRELDLSWNRFSPQQMKTLFASLRHNHYVEHLNISFNPIPADDVKLKDFGNWLRKNANLQHVDISGCLQTAAQVKRVVKKIKKSQSLLAVHMTHTPCIAADLDLQLYIEKKLDCLMKNKDEEVPSPRRRREHESLQQERSELAYEENDPIEQKIEAAAVGWKFKYELVRRAKIQLREQAYYRNQILSIPKGPVSRGDIILQRTIAHPEIRGNGRWVCAGRDCYCCERWKYTIFIVDARSVDGDDFELQGTFELLTTPDKESLELMDIREFARRLIEITGETAEDLERYLALLSHETREALTKEDLSELGSRMAQGDLTLYQKENCWYKAIMSKLPNSQYQYLPQRPAPVSLRKIYQTMAPEYCNTGEAYDEQTNVLYESNPCIFVYADYMKPSRRIERYQVKVAGKRGVLMHEYFIPMVRREQLPRFRMDKWLKLNKEQKFDKASSIFRPWIPDSNRIIKSCLKFDLSYWRIPDVAPFKDHPDALRDLEKVVEEKYIMIKHLFTVVCSQNTSWPALLCGAVEELCRLCSITDPAVDDPALVSRNFAATKFRTLRGTPGNMLCRADFLDLLVRIARAKYHDALPEPRTPQMVVDGLRTILKKLEAGFTFHPWQEFRDKHLWKREVDQVLKLNQRKLDMVHERLFPKYEPAAGIRNCIELVCHLSGLQMSDKEARFCYGMSKMTVDDEVRKTDKYQGMQPVEFYEWIGRIAHARFKDEEGEETPLDLKIERVLDEILPVYGLKRTRRIGPADDDNTSEESVFVGEEEIAARVDQVGNDNFLY